MYRIGSLVMLAASFAACSHEVATSAPTPSVASVGQQAPGQHPLATSKWWADNEVLDIHAQFPERCALHDLATSSDTVEMFCGTMLFGVLGDLGVNAVDYSKARPDLFPNANSWADYDYEHWAASVRYCPSCREAERQWLEQHRGA